MTYSHTKLLFASRLFKTVRENGTNRMSRNKIISSTQSSINPIESLLNILPCDRPIKSIQLIENVNECPSNYIPIHKTLDQDADADLFKENMLFGKKNTRYLCISKSIFLYCILFCRFWCSDLNFQYIFEMVRNIGGLNLELSQGRIQGVLGVKRRENFFNLLGFFEKKIRKPP